MGEFRKRIIQILKRWKFAKQGYIFLTDIMNFIRFGFLYPPGHLEIPDKKVTYVVMPKSACSSLKASIANREFEDNYSVHTAMMSQQGEIHPDSGSFVFSFVRNPFDRLVSCYESKYHKDIDKINYCVYQYYLFGIISKDRGFNNFAKAVCRIPGRLADQHFRSQYLTLCRHGKCVADFIGKFENLEADYEPIRLKYGFAPLGHYNKSAKGNWMDYYTPETAKMVYRKYRKDFETFGYEDEYQKLLTYLSKKEKGAV